MRWLDSFTDSADMNLSRFHETVKDREDWHAPVHGVAKNWTEQQTAATNQAVFCKLRTLLCMGRCKSLVSLKSFLLNISQLSGACILCFLHPECGNPRTKEEIKPRRVLECRNRKTRPLSSFPPPFCSY